MYFLFFKIAPVRKLEFLTTLKNLQSALLRSKEVDLQSTTSLMSTISAMIQWTRLKVQKLQQ